MVTSLHAARPDGGTIRSPRFWAVTRRLCLALILISFGYLIATAHQPVRLNWGDPWSDVDIMTAGRFMAEDGFVKTRFTPVVDIKPLDEHSFYYVHYPPLAELVNGAVQRVTGSDSLTMFRLIFIGFSALSVLFFFRFVRRIWDERVAWVATALFATNSLWLKYADCIHSHPLHLMTGFGALWWLTRWIDHRRGRDLAAFLLWCAAAFMSSYDYYFFLPIMIIGTPWLLGHRFRSRLTLEVMVLGGLGCGAGLALKCGLAIWALGWDGFLHDLHFQLLERATDKLSHKITDELGWILVLRHYRFFSPIFFVVLGVGLVGLVVPRLRGPGRGPWLFLAAGLVFILAMKQLFCEQYHVSLSLLPYSAVAGALVFVRAAEHRIGLPLALAGALVTYGWHLREVATFKHAFLDPAELAPLRAELDAHDQHNGFVYSTLSFTPSFRYSLNKHMIQMFEVPPEWLASYFEWQTRDFGGERPYVIHYEPFTRAAEDTKVVSYFAGHLNRFDWLRDPWWSRKERRRVLRARVDAQLAVIDRVADRIVQSGAFTMWRINPAKLRDTLFLPPTTVPAVMAAESVEFARAACPSPTISAPDQLGERVVRYSLHFRPYRLKIIAGGGSKVPPARPALDFELRLPQDAARGQRVRLTVLPMQPGTVLRVQGDATRTFVLGAPGTPQTIELTRPPVAGATGVVEVPLRLEVDRVDERGRGVAMQRIELEAIP